MHLVSSNSTTTTAAPPIAAFFSKNFDKSKILSFQKSANMLGAVPSFPMKVVLLELGPVPRREYLL